MSKIVNKFLLARYMFIPKLDLRQPGFTYSAYGPFTKYRERIKKFKETGNLSLFRNWAGKKALHQFFSCNF